MSSFLLSGYLALGLSSAGTAFTEVAGSGYARTAIKLASPDGVTLNNVAGVTFGPDLGASWGQVTWTALFDAPVGGNMLLLWPQRMPKYAVATGTVTLASGAVRLFVPQLLAAVANSVATNFAAGTVLGTTSAGSANVIAGTAVSAGGGVLQAGVASGLQPTNNLLDVANPALARVNINQGDVALPFAATLATDCNTGNVFHILLTGSATLGAPVNLRDGATYIWRLVQDSVGSRTLTFAPSFKFPSGAAPTLTTTAGATDILSALSDGVNVYASLMKDMR